MPSATEIQVTVELSGDGWTITTTVVPGGILPAEIFVFENTGGADLGDYVGVCSFDEMKRIQVWVGTPVPKFGNRFVRAAQAKINVPLSADTKAVVDNILLTAKALKTEISAVTSTTTIYPL